MELLEVFAAFLQQIFVDSHDGIETPSNQAQVSIAWQVTLGGLAQVASHSLVADLRLVFRVCPPSCTSKMG